MAKVTVKERNTSIIKPKLILSDKLTEIGDLHGGNIQNLGCFSPCVLIVKVVVLAGGALIAGIVEAEIFGECTSVEITEIPYKHRDVVVILNSLGEICGIFQGAVGIVPFFQINRVEGRVHRLPVCLPLCGGGGIEFQVIRIRGYIRKNALVKGFLCFGVEATIENVKIPVGIYAENAYSVFAAGLNLPANVAFVSGCQRGQFTGEQIQPAQFTVIAEIAPATIRRKCFHSGKTIFGNGNII